MLQPSSARGGSQVRQHFSEAALDTARLCLERPSRKPSLLQKNGMNWSARAACEAYIRSQAGEGWRLLPDRYDDGGLAVTVFGQGEATRALFPAGGGTVRLVREAGWGNAMRYMLTTNGERTNPIVLVSPKR
jgi:hypothetical protein